mmetsp:Transcript_37397/g.81453  ORF Transcript_37397/g.81453 Transcript_37397/m.81453 type:complete len:96 (-) Transcript_37397:362-649(-)
MGVQNWGEAFRFGKMVCEYMGKDAQFSGNPEQVNKLLVRMVKICGQLNEVEQMKLFLDKGLDHCSTHEISKKEYAPLQKEYQELYKVEKAKSKGV